MNRKSERRLRGAHDMNVFEKILVFILQMAWIIVCTLPAMGMDADDAPETVKIDYLQELYEEVTFDHQTHVDMYDCSSCHHHTAGTGPQNETCEKCHAGDAASDDVSCSGCHEKTIPPIGPVIKNPQETSLYHIDKPDLLGALHLQCLGCHQADDGPTGCRDCHAFTEAGKKRFRLKN